MNRLNHYFLGFLMATMLLGLNTCNDNQVQSKWNHHAINVDGLYADWGSDIIYNEKKRIGFGVANDSTDLYVCLVSSDQELINQIMRQGFEVKINAPKSRGNIFRVCYPVGMKLGGSNGMRDMHRGSRTGSRDNFRQNDNMSERKFGQSGDMPAIADIQTEFYLYGPKKDEKRIIPLRNNLGINVNASRSMRQLVYELKVPYQVIDEYLKLDESEMLTRLDLKFQLPQQQQHGAAEGMRRPGGRMGGPPGNDMGSGGGNFDGPRQRDMGEMNQSGQDFSFHISVLLAAPD